MDILERRGFTFCASRDFRFGRLLRISVVLHQPYRGRSSATAAGEVTVSPRRSARPGSGVRGVLRAPQDEADVVEQAWPAPESRSDIGTAQAFSSGFGECGVDIPSRVGGQAQRREALLPPAAPGEEALTPEGLGIRAGGISGQGGHTQRPSKGVSGTGRLIRSSALDKRRSWCPWWIGRPSSRFFIP